MIQIIEMANYLKVLLHKVKNFQPKLRESYGYMKPPLAVNRAQRVTVGDIIYGDQ